MRDDDRPPGEPPPPAMDGRPAPLDDPTVGDEERAVRHELLALVADAGFPATRTDLLRHVGTDRRGPVAAHLRSLPPDLVFHRPEEVAGPFGAEVTGP